MRLSSKGGPRRGAVGAVLATLLAGLLLLAAPAPALACSCVGWTVQESADQADVVISGTVVKSDREGRQPGRPNRDRLTLTVGVDRVYKGTITRDRVEVTAPSDPTTCGLGVVPQDERYFVFARAVGSDLSTNRCTGTREASSSFGKQVRSALGEGTAPQGSPSTPTSAPPERMVVDDSAPPDYVRVAAPGAALAIVGLLGLVVVRRRARRP